MTMEIGLVFSSLIILLCIGSITVMVAAVLYPALARWLERLAPATRANFLLAWAMAPVWLSITSLLLVLSPSISHWLGFGVDHCYGHGHSGHLCISHTPWVMGSIFEWALLGGLAAVASAWLIAAIARWRRARATLISLSTLSRPAKAMPGLRVVSSRRHFVFTLGLLRPRVFVTSALLDDIHPHELASVVAHEQAHQGRRDGLRLFLAETLGGWHVPAMRRRIFADLHLAIEQACDEVAASQLGDRLRVAETILRLTRLIASPVPCLGTVEPAFTGADVVPRIESLLRPPIPRHPPVLARVTVVTASTLLLGLASSDWWHHGVETLLGHLLG